MEASYFVRFCENENQKCPKTVRLLDDLMDFMEKGEKVPKNDGTAKGTFNWMVWMVHRVIQNSCYSFSHYIFFSKKSSHWTLDKQELD
jgi:hypothetical protein